MKIARIFLISLLLLASNSVSAETGHISAYVSAAPIPIDHGFSGSCIAKLWFLIVDGGDDA